MANDRIQVARGSLELGVQSQAEADELLRVGFLSPTDSFCADESQAWPPLTRLSRVPPSTAGRLATVKEATGNVGTRATRVADKVISVTGRGGSAVRVTAWRRLEDYLPRIRDSVTSAPAKTTSAIDLNFRDENFLRKLLGAASDTLPGPGRRFVGEEAFIEFCLKHRGRLFGTKN